MAFPKAPRHWRKAIKTAASYVSSGKTVTPGYCLRETRQYYGVPAVYPAAKDSLQDALNKGKAYRIRNWSKVPRGAIVYWRGGGSQYGHIAISIGKGRVISTDWPTGRYGRVHGATLMRSWGYTEAYWSPLVNGYRVWPRKKKKKVRGPKINRRRVNRSLRNPGKYRGKIAMKQLRTVRNALRRKGWSVKGFKNYPEASTRRALGKFQRKQGWTGSGADGFLGRKTAKRLGIRSRWAPLPPGKKR